MYLEGTQFAILLQLIIDLNHHYIMVPLNLLYYYVYAEYPDSI